MKEIFGCKPAMVAFLCFSIFSGQFAFAEQGEQRQFKVLEFQELIDSIQNTKGREFKLENTFIATHIYKSPLSLAQAYHYKKAESYIIEKKLFFENVVFHPSIALTNFTFKQGVSFVNCEIPNILNCVFEKALTIAADNQEESIQKTNSYFAGHAYNIRKHANIDNSIKLIMDCFFFDKIDMTFTNTVYEERGFLFQRNSLYTEIPDIGIDYSGIIIQNRFTLSGFQYIDVRQNTFCSQEVGLDMLLEKNDNVYFAENNFEIYLPSISLIDNGKTQMEKNDFYTPLIWYANVFNKDDYIEWSDFRYNIFANESLSYNYLDRKYSIASIESVNSYRIDSIPTKEKAYNLVTSSLGAFKNMYSQQHNQVWANMVFREIKDLQTLRYKYLYEEDKSFQNYYRWKVNQFLMLFSEYGTQPAKAILFATYVILIFAIFYLFFPNSWDEKNKHRIMNRMLFFSKYFKRKEGLKEVFEEEHKDQIMTYEDFSSFITESKNEIPPYFVTLSKPIYFFSVANFRVRSKILSRADILKGKWADLKPRRKAVTSITMAFWLIGILLYDLFVKFFNALMLSINTFSTLGFGEIPIKGIPRYLAIIEGFIGWFMLTIFSVSLISQLLN